MQDEVKLPPLEPTEADWDRYHALTDEEWAILLDDESPRELIVGQFCRERQLLAALAAIATLRAERDRLAPFEKLYAQDDFDRMDREFFLQQLESLGIEVTRRTDGNLRTRSTRNARAEKAEAERDRMREALEQAEVVVAAKGLTGTASMIRAALNPPEEKP
jgi:hypothetical protein